MKTLFPLRIVACLALFGSVAACGQAPTERQPPARTGDAASGVSVQQFAARGAGRLMALDTDGDGRISRAEFLDGQRGGKGDPERRFQRLDANADGVVDRAEIDAMLKRRFARLDADRDGILTPSERAAKRRTKTRSTDEG